MRIAVGGISHETSSFTPVATPIEAFQERCLLRGEAVLSFHARTNTPIGGFLLAAGEYPDLELVPTLFAEAHPSAPASAQTFEALAGELVERIAAAMPVDGVLLELHGAMVAEEHEDCEADILARVREAVGERPIVAQLDIHANVSPRMVALADVLVGRRTYPEIDMAARGQDCARILHQLLRTGERPARGFVQLPFVWGVNQATGHEPMASAMAELERVLAKPGVVAAHVSTGYPYGDVPRMGASVLVTGDRDAQRLAEELAEWIVERRASWFGELPSTAEALRATLPQARRPIVLADRFDNTGAGTPGDGTGMLRAFVDAELDDACLLYLVDPEGALACHAAGPGAHLRLALGARSSPAQGTPVTLDVEVVAVSDGAFRYGGAMYAGRAGSMGPSAHVRHRGIHVLLVSVREQPYDTAFAHTLGLRPEQMAVVGVKSQAHFRAGFEEWAGEIRVVREPSVHAPPHGSLTYRRVRPDVAAGLERA